MARSVRERIVDVRRVLAAAQRVYDDREALVDALVAATGLTPPGVELGFASLERTASDDELRSLVQAAGVARHVHVVLSANVFVAPLRALALARAAADRVTLRASPRDPVLARAIVEALEDPAVTLVDERDIARTDADSVHVYARDETIAQVRAQARHDAIVVGHGAGLGVALVTSGADVAQAAADLARDVAAFDQRGCLSPRIALVQGDLERATRFARQLAAALDDFAIRVPRGRLMADEAADAARWRDAAAFAGDLFPGAAHAVGVAAGEALLVPPSGRHLQVHAVPTLVAASRILAPLARQIVTVGSDAREATTRLALPHARTSLLGHMQRPPLDGPVDRRPASRAHPLA
jgi:hypothetical protein